MATRGQHLAAICGITMLLSVDYFLPICIQMLNIIAVHCRSIIVNRGEAF